jgi:hypothetical protein
MAVNLRAYELSLMKEVGVGKGQGMTFSKGELDPRKLHGGCERLWQFL